MTTTDLDDFFNKRLNKKKKNAGGKKFDKINTDEFAKTLEANAQAAAARDLTALNFDSTDRSDLGDFKQSNSNFNADEEWTPFESEENKDYSGLRVNILQNWKDENENEEEVQPENDTEKQPSCPWSKLKQKTVPLNIGNEDDDADESNRKKETVADPIEPVSVPVNQTLSDDTKPAETNTGTRYVPPHLRSQSVQQQPLQQAPTAATQSSTGGSKYVPPHLRNSTNTQSSQYETTNRQNDFQTSTTNRKLNKNQPNINDVSEFPSLGEFAGASVNGDDAKNEKFEQPKRGGKVDSRGNTNKIDLENKFDALSF